MKSYRKRKNKKSKQLDRSKLNVSTRTISSRLRARKYKPYLKTRRQPHPWSEISIGKNAKVQVSSLDSEIRSKMPDIETTFADRGVLDLILARVGVRR